MWINGKVIPERYIFVCRNIQKEKLMAFAEILGYIAAVGTTGAFIPQVVTVFKTKRTEDLSLGTFVLFCVGVLLWSIYGVIVNSLPIILANSLTFLMAFYILVMIVKHKKL